MSEKFDIKIKDNESGHFRRAVAAYLKITPKWFEWLGWVLIQGTLLYFSKQSKSVCLAATVALTQGFLLSLYLISLSFKEFRF